MLNTAHYRPMSKANHPKKPAQLDWHRADIKAALEKAGWSLRRLSIHHGYKSPTTLKNALAQPWPKGEHLIADAIGVHPATIWPSRYAGDGTPISGRARQYTKRSVPASPVRERSVA